MTRKALISTIIPGFVIVLMTAVMAQSGVVKEPGLLAINPASVYDHCKQLAGPDFAGRLTGDAGYTAAAHWAADQFRAWGVQPLFGGSFLQAYSSPYTVIDQAAMTLILPGKDGAAPTEVPLEAGKDFLPLLFSDSGDHTAAVVFAGWGISAPELGYDDYAGLDVSGKFVLCFRGTPDRRDQRYTDYDQHRTRMETARRKGALGIIYIYNEPQANPNGDWLAGFTPAEISSTIADRILAERNIKSDDLRADLSRYHHPLSFPLETRIHFQVRSRHFPNGTGYNIAGYVEGSDPVLKKECVVLGAHFDHCGAHMGMIFPGANDNASGSAAVMEAARAFAQAESRPKRSVMFVLFGGEEMGLMGSHYFAEHLGYGFSKYVGMLNFDMVGEGDGAWCGYSAQPESLKATIDRADAGLKLLRGGRAISHIGVRSSDFAPFFLKGIPCVSFSSNGPHLAYHQPGDTIYRINPDILAGITRLGARTAWYLADE